MKRLICSYLYPLPIFMRLRLPVIKIALVSALAQCCFILPAPAQNIPVASRPTYPVIAHAPMFQLQGHTPAVELTGIDLIQGDTPIRGRIPKIEAGKPLSITLHLRPTSELISDRKLRINIRPPGVGPAPGYLESFDFNLGQWDYRALVQKTYRMELPLRRFAGRGMLHIAEVDPADKDWRRMATLWTMQIDMPAHVWRSSLEDARIAKAFGPQAKRLHAAFSLGPGTEVILPLQAFDYPIPKVGFISNVSWDSDLTIGAPICQVVLRQSGSEEETPINVVYGETTYKWVVSVADGDPAEMSAPIAWSSLVPGDESSKKARRYYTGVVPVPKGARPSEIVFRFQGNAGMLHVYEVVLLGNS